MNRPVGMRCQLLVVRHDDERLIHLIPQFEEERVQFLLMLRIQTAGRLIGQDNCRMVYQRPCYGDPLFLSTGQLRRFMRHPVAQPEKVQHLLCPLFGNRTLLLRYQCRNHHILQRRKFRQQLMELEHESDILITECRQFALRKLADIDAINRQAAAIRRIQRPQNLKQRRLPGAARTDYRNDLAPVDFQIDALQYLFSTCNAPKLFVIPFAVIIDLSFQE